MDQVRSPGRVDDVELAATLSWVHGYKPQRLHESLAYVVPAELEDL